MGAKRLIGFFTMDTNIFSLIYGEICAPLVNCMFGKCDDTQFNWLNKECFPSWYTKRDGIADKILGQEDCTGESTYDPKKCRDGEESYCELMPKTDYSDRKCVPGLKCGRFRFTDQSVRCCKKTKMLPPKDPSNDQKEREFCCKDDDCKELDIEYYFQDYEIPCTKDEYDARDEEKAASCKGLVDRDLNDAKCGSTDIQRKPDEFRCCTEGIDSYGACKMPKDALCGQTDDAGESQYERQTKLQNREPARNEPSDRRPSSACTLQVC